MGEHEPPTNRSFYFSLAASTIRFAIIVALVIGGVVVIDQAFAPPSAAGGGGGDGGGGPVTGLTGGPTTTQSPQPTAPTGSTGNTQPEPSPQVEGVRVAVFNGSGQTGLAADTMQTFEDDFGYVEAQPPADAPAPYSVTTIYYRGADDKVEGEYLAETFFAPLGVEAKVKKLQPGTADINQDVQLAIFLGTDYSAASA